VLGVGPLAQLAGRRVEGPASDPVARAAAAGDAGFVDPVDAARLAHAPADDALALHGRALRAHRDGDLATARAHFDALLALEGSDPVALNNAAGVRLAQGDTAGAIELYERAVARAPSAALWFNLSQAHARAIDMDAHAAALAAAQAADPEATSALTRRLGALGDAEVAELPLPAERVRARLFARGGDATAAALRERVAPGRLGRSAWRVGAFLVGIAAAAAALARTFDHAGACRECGVRLCRRCGTAAAGAGLCAGCGKRRQQARHGGPWESARSGSPWRARLRGAARAAARLAPGVIGPTPRRPLVALLALAAGGGALALGLGRHGAVSDPASVGAAGALALGLAACALLALFAALAAASAGREH
jgi:tetratricopeptide (TPR) repeat protein